MKVGYMTGVLMGEVAPNTDVKNTFVEENEGSQVSLKDGVQESSGSDESTGDDSSSDSGSYTFLNTNMIIYVILGLALFKAFKK